MRLIIGFGLELGLVWCRDDSDI